MTTELDQANARIHGIEDFIAGKDFSQSRYQGFKPDDIELRWRWQLGWLRARQDQWDTEKKMKS